MRCSACTGTPTGVFDRWSPDGRRLASASFDRSIKVWDAGTGQEVLTLHGHDDRVWSVAWSPDGRRLASTSDDGTVRIWGVPSKSGEDDGVFRDALARAWHREQAHASSDRPRRRLTSAG